MLSTLDRPFWKDSVYYSSYSTAHGVSEAAIKLSRSITDPKTLSRKLAYGAKQFVAEGSFRAGVAEVAQLVAFTGLMRMLRTNVPISASIGIAHAASCVEMCRRTGTMKKCLFTSALGGIHVGLEWELYCHVKNVMSERKLKKTAQSKLTTGDCFMAGGLANVALALTFGPLTGSGMAFGVRHLQHDVLNFTTRICASGTGYAAVEKTYDTLYPAGPTSELAIAFCSDPVVTEPRHPKMKSFAHTPRTKHQQGHTAALALPSRSRSKAVRAIRCSTATSLRSRRKSIEPSSKLDSPQMARRNSFKVSLKRSCSEGDMQLLSAA